MTKRHALLMLLCCLVPIAAISAIFVFHVAVSSTLVYGIALLCPLMMLFMMWGMGEHNHDSSHVHDANPMKDP
jgi:uncharacterized membrane protein